ncbi:MAG: HD-GYP domain-containing protein [Deltaproteobacteria bacterium]|nr:HD-GYP domain-containing protein [Deltaproteobacteria bacterium]
MNGPDGREAILKNINAALKSRKLYPPGHPAIAAPVNKACALLTDELKGMNNLAVGLVNDTLIFEDDMVEDGEKLYSDLIQNMAEKNVEAMIFEKGFTSRELTDVFEILSGSQVYNGHELQKELHSRGVMRITLKNAPAGKRNILEIYNGAVEIVENVMGEVRMGKIPKSGPVKEIVAEMTESVFSDPHAIIGLTMIKNYDNYLYNHSVNVSIMSLSLGRAMGLSVEEVHAIGVASLLHDIGKTGVSEQIIRKPGGLSSEEWEKVKQHPQLGSNIIKRMEGIDATIGRLIYEHHIKYDHSGYPETVENLHPHSQIITICDAYDALTTLRVYQKPHDPVEAIKIMSNFSGRHFNPDILKSFMDMMGLYPTGTMVRLATGELGVVLRLNEGAPEKPVIKILYNEDGVELEKPFEVDLSTDSGREIVTNVNPATTATDLGAFFEKEAAG